MHFLFRRPLGCINPITLGLLAALLASVCLLPRDDRAIATEGSKAELADSELLQRTIADFELIDFRGQTHSLKSFAANDLVVVFFTGTECPLAKLYGHRLQKIADEYEGVAFVGICSNSQDSLTDMEHYARKHEIKYPLLKDERNRVADAFGATRTPQVFVLDQQRKVRYVGRIDGQFTFGSGVGLAAPAPKRNDLRIAIDELLAGKEVSQPVTIAKGCIIGRERQVDTAGKVTYSKQISRLFQKRCNECHRDGQIAPFALGNYEDAAGWGEMIAEVVREQRMPPWHADPKFGHFANDARLSKAEKQLIFDWVDAGCPEGNPKDLPAPVEYQSGWFMPQEPDQIIYMADAEVDIKAEGVEDYRYFEIDPGFKEDKWVKIAECMPGNREVVHHIIVYIKSPEAKDSGIGDHELLVGYAPGTRPFLTPEGWARRIPAGSKLIFEMHYTPIGSPQKDRSSLGLVFIDESEVTHHSWTTNSINRRFRIPAHDPDYQLTAESTIEQDSHLLSLFPHMHIRGKAFRYTAIFPDKTKKVLLDIPQYDFNWQNSFVLDEPMELPKGTKIFCEAVYDNSEQNLANPDPNKNVTWGEQTWEEMLIGWYDLAVKRS